MKQPINQEDNSMMGVTQPAEVFAKMHKRLSLNAKSSSML